MFAIGLLWWGGGLWRNRAHEPKLAAPLRADLDVGGRLCLPGFLPSGVPKRSVVVVTNQQCPFCRQGRAFQEIVVQRCLRKEIPVLYLVPAREDNDQLAHELTELRRTVIRVDLAKAGVMRVPTILTIDSAGRILSQWTGASPSAEGLERVVEELLSGGGRPRYVTLTAHELREVALREPRAQRIALAPPSQAQVQMTAQKVIPLAELEVRADYELDRGRPLIVDCIQGSVPPFWCQQAALTLSNRGFSNLYAAGLVGEGSSGYCEPGESHKEKRFARPPVVFTADRTER